MHAILLGFTTKVRTHIFNVNMCLSIVDTDNFMAYQGNNIALVNAGNLPYCVGICFLCLGWEHSQYLNLMQSLTSMYNVVLSQLDRMSVSGHEI